MTRRILVADHEVGFKVVHTVLAVVSIGLSVLAWREARRASRGVTPAPDADPSYVPTA